MRIPKIILTTTMLLCIFAGMVTAGEIHPTLAAKMDMIASDEHISVIVIMAEQAPIAAMNADLKLRRASLRQRHQEIVLALQDATRGQSDLTAWLDHADRGDQIAGYKGYWIANMLVVSATPAAIEDMAMRADVALVEENFTVELIAPFVGPAGDGERGDRGIGVTPGLRAIRAVEVWYELGITGVGTIVADLDTGVDGNHPALASRWRGLHAPASECWLDVLGGGTTFPVDNYGHGTHVLGTMTGLAYDDSIGVAPGAEWIACNAIDQGVGSGFDNDVIDALEWFADPDGDPYTNDDVPDVVQNSWRINEGFGGDYTDCDTRWWAAIDNCEAAGVVTTWSAGNEGSSSGTIGSPADRATTPFNAFSVGAVDATNDPTFPYVIAGFSSRGPSGCDVAPELKIKPEVVAPGVDVYSSVPGGGYDGTWDGTSMSGPHVAGVVGLMREANPDLDVDTIKLILLETARDLGTTGDDNVYGHGFIDAYAAVLAAMAGFGNIEGHVYNASWGNLPLPGASVGLLGTTVHWSTNASGYYSGAAAEDHYTVTADLPGFAQQSAEVFIVSNTLIVQDFYLTDIAGPEFDNLVYSRFTSDTAGPYPISVDVRDFSTVGAVTLHYRLNNGTWDSMPMSGGPLTYGAEISGLPAYSSVDFYIEAMDGNSLVSLDPPNAPMQFHSFFITEEIYAFDAESGLGDWQLGAAGDDATSGIWIQADPIGTEYNGDVVQPEDDHTLDPGVICFVTGNGSVGGSAGEQDVDGGCTTLLSPVFDLSDASQAFVSYWRWYGETGLSTDDEFSVDVTTNGSDWVPLERVTNDASAWSLVQLEIGEFVALSDLVQFRFVACDLNSGGLVEAAIDDFGIEMMIADLTAVPGDDGPVYWGAELLQSSPNPFHPGAGPSLMTFSLKQSARTSLKVYDISGRLVRVLVDEDLSTGSHSAVWNGRDDSGHALGSGVYFYRLETRDGAQSRKVMLLR